MFGASLVWRPGEAVAQGASSVSPPPVAGEAARRFVIRFLTDTDFPPFHYHDEDGGLTGFDIDLARAICQEAGTQCEIITRAWDQLLPALRKGEGDAVIAALRIAASTLTEADLTDRYFYTTAWFAGRRGGGRGTTTPESLENRSIAVVKGSAHEAYLRTFFRDSRIEALDSVERAREALRAGKVDYLFDDGIGLVFWVNGALSANCCEMKGGPFFEPRFFGDGLAIAVSRQDPELKRLINGALARLRQTGRYEELLLRYFPNRLF